MRTTPAAQLALRFLPSVAADPATYDAWACRWLRGPKRTERLGEAAPARHALRAREYRDRGVGGWVEGSDARGQLRGAEAMEKY